MLGPWALICDTLVREVTEAVSKEGLLVEGRRFKYSLVFELFEEIEVFSLEFAGL